jgi:hypothetical protein
MREDKYYVRVKEWETAKTIKIYGPYTNFRKAEKLTASLELKANLEKYYITISRD